jgi:hypothetical protein
VGAGVLGAKVNDDVAWSYFFLEFAGIKVAGQIARPLKDRERINEI